MKESLAVSGVRAPAETMTAAPGLPQLPLHVQGGEGPAGKTTMEQRKGDPQLTPSPSEAASPWG